MSGVALAAGWAGDLAVGDPRRFHPVAGFGRLALALEGLLHPRERPAPRLPRARGALFTALLVGGAAGAAELAARGAERLAGRRGRALVLALVTWGALGGRSLAREGTRIAELLERGDLAGARAALPSLAGRDPSQLDASGISRAVVESLAENTADAVVGALVWGVVAGPGGVAAYRAANTLDAMVGHRSPRYERFGFAAAKLDDALGWPGARLGALLTVALAPAVEGSGKEALRILRRDGAAHPSPNAGRMEAAFAGALGLTLGGPLRYGERTEERPRLGDGRAATPADARRAARLSLVVGAGAALVCAAARHAALRALTRQTRNQLVSQTQGSQTAGELIA
ncbi:cobalamin biosynthesis protein [Conexibacter sp. JD483]|uniref:cobalamin biosynthesis protein n=1 Tax=unclassified Conexibacter TaxID=2627773 RepID=UPI00271CEBD3|nr:MULTISPECIES: cobalamin biosynthesis protein [unclassified Conexibacter]MDO8189439.1 cobalamin biosynthesis protein [Conexibacter sp. CPCC 205706]MDO8202028.1 cobalamin biosynthesis protein [Conexibacter sp. CPCC 205762]MDR9372588.1 cobalamin biosynthesis protein [Conexibacter sp. JD483]